MMARTLGHGTHFTSVYWRHLTLTVPFMPCPDIELGSLLPGAVCSDDCECISENSCVDGVCGESVLLLIGDLIAVFVDAPIGYKLYTLCINPPWIQSLTT